MALISSTWQFNLMALSALFAAHLAATAVLSWSVATRKRRSPIRQRVQKQLMARLIRATGDVDVVSSAAPASDP